MNRLFPLLIIFLLSVSSQAQFAEKSGLSLPTMEPEKDFSANKFDPKKIVYGGNFGLNFSRNFTLIDVSPLVGYRVTEKFTPGIGLSYIYYRQQFITSTGGTVTFKNSWYGGRLYARYTLFQNFFLHGEYELMNYAYYDNLTLEEERIWFGSPIIGAGYLQPTGGRGAFMVSALYVLNADDPRSPYYFSGPLQIRVGFVMR